MRMTRQRRIQLAAAAAVLAAMLAAVWLQMAGTFGPRHQGRTAGEWFDVYAEAKSQSPEAQAALRELARVSVPMLTDEMFALPLRHGFHARVRSLSSWTYRLIPAERPINWDRRRMAIKALGEIGPAAGNAVPELIRAITHFEHVSVDPAKGNRYGTVGSQGPRIDTTAIEALMKVAPDSPQVRLALTTLIGRSPTIRDPRTQAAIKALALTEPLSGEIQHIIDALRWRLRSWWQPGWDGKSTNLAGYLRLVEDAKASGQPAGEFSWLELFAWRIGTATNLPAADRAVLARTLVELHGKLANEPLFLLQDSIVMLDPAAGLEIFAYLLNQTESPDYVLRLRALEGLRRMGPLAAGRFEGREHVASNYVARRLHDDVPMVRTWAAEALKAITNTAPASH